MALLPELEKFVDQATPGSFRGLHQMIVGPSPSGKTTQAREYVAALRARGAGGTTAIFAHASDWRSFDWSAIHKPFHDAKGGVLIIDELEKADERVRDHVLHKVVEVIEKDEMLVILTGEASLIDLNDRDSGFARRMNAPLVLTRKLTKDDIIEFNLERQNSENMRNMRARETEKRRAEWREARDEDLRPHAKLLAPKVARFRKPESAS